MLALLALIVVASLLGFAGFIRSELKTEARFRNRYGADWQVEYEKVHGSLAAAHARIGLSAVGIVSVSGLVAWLYRILRPGNYSRRRSRQKTSEYVRPAAAHLERTVRYRRNAILGNYFGGAGILLGVFLVIFRVGIFSDHSDEVVLGMFVFLAGYGAVIAGCGYWLRAKQWNEAIAFIGLMPLAIPMIPFVRLVLVAAPAILPVSMTMMPLILIVVVFALPDKSGASGTKSSWRRHRGHG
jgi:hypothetical protein